MIKQVGILYQGSERRAEWIVDGSPLDAIESFRDVDALIPPTRGIESFLVLADNTRVKLPFCGVACRIPDHTGVVAIFDHGQYLNSQGEDVFARPNNAAIFNADGSLRCQVHFAGEAKGLIIERYFTRYINRKPAKNMYGPPGELLDTPIIQFGFLIGAQDAPPESFYILNCETGELTNSHFSVPY